MIANFRNRALDSGVRKVAGDAVMNRPALSIQECWAEGGRLQVEVGDEGATVLLRGNREGLVGLARVLLWHVQHGEGPVDLAELGAFRDGGPILSVGVPQ